MSVTDTNGERRASPLVLLSVSLSLCFSLTERIRGRNRRFSRFRNEIGAPATFRGTLPEVGGDGTRRHTSRLILSFRSGIVPRELISRSVSRNASRLLSFFPSLSPVIPLFFGFNLCRGRGTIYGERELGASREVLQECLVGGRVRLFSRGDGSRRYRARGVELGP